MNYSPFYCHDPRRKELFPNPRRAVRPVVIDQSPPSYSPFYPPFLSMQSSFLLPRTGPATPSRKLTLPLPPPFQSNHQQDCGSFPFFLSVMSRFGVCLPQDTRPDQLLYFFSPPAPFKTLLPSASPLCFPFGKTTKATNPDFLNQFGGLSPNLFTACTLPSPPFSPSYPLSCEPPPLSCEFLAAQTTSLRRPFFS